MLHEGKVAPADAARAGAPRFRATCKMEDAHSALPSCGSLGGILGVGEGRVRRALVRVWAPTAGQGPWWSHEEQIHEKPLTSMPTNEVPAVSFEHEGSDDRWPQGCISQVRERLIGSANVVEAEEAVESSSLERTKAMLEDLSRRLQHHHAGIDRALVVRAGDELHVRAHERSETRRQRLVQQESCS